MSIEIERARTESKRTTCFKVRYDVFVSETGYIEDHDMHGLESDSFDVLDNTYHFLAYYDGEPAGAARLILPNEEVAQRTNTLYGLPIEALFNLKNYKNSNMRIAEISRSSVKNKYRSTKTIFYLWMELINFALSRGITDLVTNVNPETDKLCDAYLLYSKLRSENLQADDISVKPKRPGIGKIRNFRFPLYGDTCCSLETGDDSRTDIPMPQTLKLFSRVGARFTGEPVYCEKIDMCALPMNWRLKDIEKTSFGRIFKHRTSLKEVAN